MHNNQQEEQHTDRAGTGHMYVKSKGDSVSLDLVLTI